MYSSETYCRMDGLEVSVYKRKNGKPHIYIQIPKRMKDVELIISEDFNGGAELDTTLRKLLGEA